MKWLWLKNWYPKWQLWQQRQKTCVNPSRSILSHQLCAFARRAQSPWRSCCFEAESRPTAPDLLGRRILVTRRLRALTHLHIYLMSTYVAASPLLNIHRRVLSAAQLYNATKKAQTTCITHAPNRNTHKQISNQVSKQASRPAQKRRKQASKQTKHKTMIQ